MTLTCSTRRCVAAMLNADTRSPERREHYTRVFNARVHCRDGRREQQSAGGEGAGSGPVAVDNQTADAEIEEIKGMSIGQCKEELGAEPFESLPEGLKHLAGAKRSTWQAEVYERRTAKKNTEVQSVGVGWPEPGIKPLATVSDRIHACTVIGTSSIEAYFQPKDAERVGQFHENVQLPWAERGNLTVAYIYPEKSQNCEGLVKARVYVSY